MNRESKLETQKQAETYLQEKHLYEIFEQLMSQLIIEQPTDPLKYLIDQLESPEHKKIFIVGPPGSKVLPLALALCDYFHFTCVSVRDLLNKQVSSKSEIGQEIEAQMKRFGLVEDRLVNDIVWNHLKKLEKEEEKVVVVAGYPMTKSQAIQVQIQAKNDDKLIVINLCESKIIEACMEKLSKSENENDGRYREIDKDLHQELSNAYALQYNMNISIIKDMFKNSCYQLDGEQSIIELIEELAKILKYKINCKAPKRAAQIIICGAPGRSQLAQQICEKYGLTYISVSHLLKSQAVKNEEFGQKIMEDMKNGELVSDLVIIPLLQERLAQKDCQMQGFVLDGFPKNSNQLSQFEQLNLAPNFILIFETDDNLSFDKKSDHNSGIQKDLDQLEDGDANSRIINLSNETEDIQKKRWKETLREIEKTYSESKIIFKVSSKLPSANVIEKIFYHLENSI